MLVSNFGQFNAASMTFTLTFILQQQWYDPRLVTNLSERVIITAHRDEIWLPDLYFPNAVAGKLHDVATTNSLLWLLPKGHLLYTQKLTLEVSCTLHLNR
jgi:hypothetical protein